MINHIADFALALAWLLALLGFAGGAYAGVTGSSRVTHAVAAAMRMLCLACAVAIGLLGYQFLNNDYRNQYVWQFSNRAMDPVYKVSAIWGGMDGSMLLWTFLLSVSGAIVASRVASYPRRLAPWVLAVLSSNLLFFLTVVLFITNPFRFLKAHALPDDGNGLNPLLQNPYMAIHPPNLYLGFTTFAVPYAFCLAALLSRDLSNEWIRLTRRWTLVAWGFLTCGIVLGGHWAYVELGWGGFWAWDPVENASFLPWLTGTAFLHSVMIQERKNMLKVWNVWLIVLTYGLTVFGTFLTRSGVVQSVHAFASTDVGWIFLVYLALVFVAALVLSVLRRKDLRPERKLESYLSREAFFLLNNLVFLSICFATLWGVMFPVLSEAVTGTKQTVSIPFFNAVNVPLFLLLIFLMGAGPLIAWRKATLGSVLRIFVRPFIAGFAAALILLWAGIDSFYPLLSYGLCVFVLGTLMGELHRGMRAQRLAANPDEGTLDAAGKLFRRQRVKYGGYLVHLGVVIAVIGITASMAQKVEREFTLAPGQSYEVGRFRIMLTALTPGQNDNYSFLAAEAGVYERNSGAFLETLRPELRRYLRNDESTTEVALRSTLREDLYLVMAGLNENGDKAALKVFINPLQAWLWIGAIVMLVGTVVVVLPRTQPAYQTAVAGAAVRSTTET